MDKFRKNEPMSSHTTIKIGGPARLFVYTRSEKDLRRSVKAAIDYKIPFLIIGGGSNLLVSDKGFDGLIIKNCVKGMEIDEKKVKVKSGTALGDFIDFLIEKEMAGMECMSGIPGTVGGAVYGNAGAYGQTISDHLLRVKVFDGKESLWFSKEKCKFDYRESRFKKNKLILLETEFLFEKGDKKSLRKNAREILELRKKKYPRGLACPGSFFKNILAKSLPANILKRIPDNKIIHGKISAGYLLEAVGAKGKRKGKIKIANYHGNLFLNEGDGTASDFLSLADFYKEKVKKKFNIELEPEVQLIGFDKKLAVLGLGLEGKDLVKFLLRQGAKVTVFDQKKEKELDFSDIDKKKISLVCGKNYLQPGFLDFDVIFRSPGIYRYIPELVKAEKKGLKVSSAIKLFFDLCPAKIIGVTGTKGKGTTSTLIYKILKEAGKDVYLAGNIGKPYLELLPRLKKNSWVILELSSFQLIDLHKSPHIGVVLNITSDHLDWHKNKREYQEAKLGLVQHQQKMDFAVLNFDYKSSRGFAKHTKAKVYHFSRTKRVKGCFVDADKIILSTDNRNREVGEVNDLLLRGKHNWENVTAAVCASRLAGTKLEAIKKAVFNFRGLEHRLELVGKIREITFYNDSFATGPQSTIAAIKSFVEPTTVILGGYDKGLDYRNLGREIAKRKNLKTVILIGEVAQKIYHALRSAGYNNLIIKMGKDSMEKIVKMSIKHTSKGGVVLLSPAAASFDMFKDYKDRGEKFKKVIKNYK